MASDTVVRAPHRRAGQGEGRQGSRRYRPVGSRRDTGCSWSALRPRRALPFEIEVPNAETRAAMAELEQGTGKAFDSVAELIADLNAED